MSVVEKETIEVIAQSIGISNLSPDAALTLAPDVEYRLREIIQEAIKCMRHSKRTILTTDDVDAALSIRNVEWMVFETLKPIYGFTSDCPLRFKRAIGHKDLFYIEDKEVDFKDVIEAPLPKAPLDAAISCHWLAIEGVQPAIPENAPVEVIAPHVDVKNVEQKDGPVDIKLPVKHVLSRELQLYFDKIAELTLRRSESGLFKEALVSLASDSGLHPLVPYFTFFIADEVSRGLSDYQLLLAILRLVWSLLQNPHIHIEPYLHQLMPSVVTCLVAKRLGNKFAENHWELRDFAAKLVALICKRFGHVYNSLQTRLTKTLVNALLDPKKSLTQHYGAIQGLTALGPNVIRQLVLPNINPYLRLLEPEMLLEKQKNEVKRHEAWLVYGALLRSAGYCIYDRLKIFLPLPSPAGGAILKSRIKVITTHPENHSGKRKANLEHMEQTPAKKMAIDGPSGVLPDDSLSSQVHMEATAPPSSQGSDNAPSTSDQMPHISGSGHEGGKDKNINPAIKRAAILTQVWKEDLRSGELLSSLFELFGESFLSFIPAPEMSLFL